VDKITLVNQIDLQVNCIKPLTAIKKWNDSIKNTEFEEYILEETIEDFLINDIKNLGFVQGMESNENGFYIWLNIYSNR